MKRPVLALLALLASLAVGLLAISPRPAEAMMLGELFCVGDLVSPPHEVAVNDFCPVCPFADEFADAPPRVCTPPGVPAAEEAEAVAPAEPASPSATPTANATAHVELNPPATNNVPDSNDAWEEAYGQYYGDFYGAEEAYNDDYADEYEEDAGTTTPDAAVNDATPSSSNFRYGDEYDPWSPVLAPTVSAPGPSDLILDDEEFAAQQGVATTTSDAPYDLYGRQVGDEHYGYDFEEHDPEASEYEDAYEYEYEYEVDEQPSVESEAVTDSSATAPADEADQTSDSYYEQYYPDYYAELYGDAEDETTDSETDAAVETEAVETTDDEGTQYDAAYEELFFGDAAASQSDPAFVDELAEQSSSDAEGDLPWADEVPADDTAANESTSGAAESDYNSDYADDYYRSLFGEDEETWEEAQESQEWTPEGSGYDNTYDYFHRPCHEECLHPRAFDATRLAVDLGRQVVAWTESLELVSMHLHSACLQMAELPVPRDTK